MQKEKLAQIAQDLCDDAATVLGVVQRMVREPPLLEMIAENLRRVRNALRLEAFALETLDAEARLRWKTLNDLLNQQPPPGRLNRV